MAPILSRVLPSQSNHPKLESDSPSLMVLAVIGGPGVLVTTSQPHLRTKYEFLKHRCSNLICSY